MLRENFHSLFRMALYTSFTLGSWTSLIAHGRVALLVGGGDEAEMSPAGEIRSVDPDGNQFHESFVNLGTAFRNADWRVQILYGGNETVCDPNSSGGRACPAGAPADSPYRRSSLASDIGVDEDSMSMATRVDFFASLDRLIEARMNDQILFIFPTHGGHNFDRGTVRLSLGNGEFIDTNDPELTRRLQELRQGGAQLGFVLGSCESGRSIPDLSDFGCVLSTSNSSTVAYSNDANADRTLASCMLSGSSCRSIFSGPPPALTLDEVYIRTLVRSANETPDVIPLLSGDITSQALFDGMNNTEARQAWINQLTARVPETIRTLLPRERIRDELEEQVNYLDDISFYYQLAFSRNEGDNLFESLGADSRTSDTILEDCSTLSNFNFGDLYENIQSILEVTSPIDRATLYDRLLVAAGNGPMLISREEFIGGPETLRALRTEIEDEIRILRNLYGEEDLHLNDPSLASELSLIRIHITNTLRVIQDKMRRLLSLISLNRAASYIRSRESGNMTPAQQACADFRL